MSWPERISFLVLGLLLTGWLYWLTYRQQLTQDHGEQALDHADRILWMLQARMATRGLMAWLAEPEPPAARSTEPEPDAHLSRRARGRLRLQERLRPTPEPRPLAPEPEPEPTPTIPLALAWDAPAARDQLDDIDVRLARFTFAGGHRAATPPNGGDN